MTETKYPTMTIGEIETRFDGEWVLLGAPEIEDSVGIIGGQVLCHHVDRDVVYGYVKVAYAEGFDELTTMCYKEASRGMAVML